MAAIVRLTLTRFRNYPHLRLAVGPEPVVLTGANGAGKTNLLEAISFLAPGRGLRGARLAEVERGGPGLAPSTESGWAVAATVATALGPVELGTGREPAAAGAAAARERRVVHVDGRAARSQTVLGEHLGVLWLTPQMDRLFLEGSTGRRRFLDRLVFGFDSAHAGRLTRHERAQRERARLLHEGGRDPGWLASLEEEMATHAVAVAAARLELVRRLDVACAAGVGPFPRALLAVRGPVEALLAEERPVPAAVELLRARLRECRRRDADSGTTALGAHRGDLAVEFCLPGASSARTIPAAQCSTGEQKALLLAIVLAHARLLAGQGRGPPVLLLDEVAAHLDAGRRAALFEELLALGGQAWLTGTDRALFEPLLARARHFTVEPGGFLRS